MMVDYRTIDPIIIDNVCADGIISTTKLPMYFGAQEPADLYWTPDGGSQSLVATSQTPVQHGVAVNILPGVSWPRLSYVDKTTKLTVSQVYGEPQGCTDAEFYAEKNIVFVGAVGRWEAIAYRDVSVVGGNVVLSHLLRCRKGTWEAAYKHSVKDTVVYGTQDLVRFERPASEQGTTAQCKIVPRGYAPTFASGLGGPVFMAGGSSRCFPPINARVARVSGDLVITWTRVDRSGVQLHDLNGNVPLTDSPESYTLCIYKLPAVVTDSPKRIITGLSSPTYTYTAAKQAADGTSTDIAIGLLISQYSAKFGFGYSYQGGCYVR